MAWPPLHQGTVNVVDGRWLDQQADDTNNDGFINNGFDGASGGAQHRLLDVIGGRSGNLELGKFLLAEFQGGIERE